MLRAGAACLFSAQRHEADLAPHYALKPAHEQQTNCVSPGSVHCSVGGIKGICCHWRCLIKFYLIHT